MVAVAPVKSSVLAERFAVFDVSYSDCARQTDELLLVRQLRLSFNNAIKIL